MLKEIRPAMVFIIALGFYITPAMLGGLPASVREAYQTAVSNGVTTAFLWAAIVAVIGVVATLVIKEVPLRGSGPTSEAPAEPALAA